MRIPMTDASRFTIGAPKYLTKLRYTLAGVYNNGGATSGSKSFNCNGLYDVDPAVASTAVVGFSELSAIWGTNRVIACRAKGWISNLEAQALAVCIGWTPDVQAINTFLPSEYGNRYCKKYVMSAKGGMDRMAFNQFMNMEKLFGDESYTGDLANFRGTSASNPSSLFSLNIGFEPFTAVLAAGIAVFGELEFDVEFTNPTTLAH